MTNSRIPQVGLHRTVRHEYYRDGVGPYPGVTTVLRVIDKPAIIGWAKRETARCAIENYDFVADLLKRGGPKAAQDWLASIPDYKRDTAADLGSAVHRLAEQHARAVQAGFAGISSDGSTPEQIPYVEAYIAFVHDYRPVFKSYERMVFSEKGYGGTFDWLARIDGRLILGDTKTGKDVFPETALQLAALGHADHIGLPDDPKRYAMPKVDGYAVLHLRPEKYVEGYRLIEYDVTDAEYAAFLAALALTRWRREREKSVIGEAVAIKEEAIA
jgi:hypothetical protein